MLAVGGVPADRFVAFVPEGPGRVDLPDPRRPRRHGRRREGPPRRRASRRAVRGAVAPARRQDRARVSLGGSVLPLRASRARRRPRGPHASRPSVERNRDRVWGAELRKVIRERGHPHCVAAGRRADVRGFLRLRGVRAGSEGQHVRDAAGDVRALGTRRRRRGSRSPVPGRGDKRGRPASPWGGSSSSTCSRPRSPVPSWSDGSGARAARRRRARPRRTSSSRSASGRSAPTPPHWSPPRGTRFEDEGFSLALDDVGTGRDGGEALERLRPDYLKVDASVVRGIDANLVKQEIFATIARDRRNHRREPRRGGRRIRRRGGGDAAAPRRPLRTGLPLRGPGSSRERWAP